MTKTTLQGTIRGARRRGRQRKRWEDNIKEWTGLDISETAGFKVIGGAPTTLRVTGLMMMMIMVEFLVEHKLIKFSTWVPKSKVMSNQSLMFLEEIQSG